MAAHVTPRQSHATPEYPHVDRDARICIRATQAELKPHLVMFSLCSRLSLSGYQFSGVIIRT